MLNSKRVLVTGAAGVIGSHLVEALVTRGARVTCLVRYNSTWNIGNRELLPADIKATITIAAGNTNGPNF
jgi:nucleoside-diphosphate-sugar epimerase